MSEIDSQKSEDGSLRLGKPLNMPFTDKLTMWLLCIA